MKLVVSCLVLLPVALASPRASTSNWLGWRGTAGNGLAEGAPPTTWSETENVRWKTPIPGKGLSSPVVLDGVVYLTTAVPTQPASGAEGEETPEPEERERARERRRDGAPAEFAAGPPSAQRGQGRGRGGRGGRGGRRQRPEPVEHEFFLVAVEHASGKLLWQKSAAKLVPHEVTHGDGSYATPTLVSDGERLFVSFGSFGIFAYDKAGERLWQTDLGDMKISNEFGEGSSPVLAGDNVVILWAHEGESFLVALDQATGEERWRTPREPGTSWLTPTVAESDGRTLILIPGRSAQAYDAATGELAWYHGEDGRPKGEPAEASAGGRRGGGPVATAVVAGDLVLFGTGGRRGGLMALTLDSLGEVDGVEDHFAWEHEGDAPFVPSPIVVDDLFYALKSNGGQLSAFEVESGEEVYAGQRMEGVVDAYASPVAAGGHIYFTGRDGTFEVVRAGSEYESVAINRLDDAFDASPAVVGDTLVLRGATHLYCIGE